MHQTQNACNLKRMQLRNEITSNIHQADIQSQKSHDSDEQDMILPRKMQPNKELTKAVYVAQKQEEEVKQSKGLMDLEALDCYMDPLPHL